MRNVIIKIRGRRDPATGVKTYTISVGRKSHAAWRGLTAERCLELRDELGDKYFNDPRVYSVVAGAVRP